jgi:hypothetical protein
MRPLSKMFGKSLRYYFSLGKMIAPISLLFVYSWKVHSFLQILTIVIIIKKLLWLHTETFKIAKDKQV